MNKEEKVAFILGYIVGEGCFYINIQKARKQFRMPFEIKPEFVVYTSIDDSDVLKLIKDELKIGHIMKVRSNNKVVKRKEMIQFRVSGLKNAHVLISYFNGKFMGKRKKDYEIWKQAVKIIGNDDHRTINGILELAKIRDKMGKISKPENYRDYNWFKDYLEENYKNYKPAYLKNKDAKTSPLKKAFGTLKLKKPTQKVMEEIDEGYD